ncbi:MAG: tetratricopeptide repeat protein, partial [Chitinivibrionales bacterium]|nr:tetratricopeptide repeat protein [Chitinivibrionales bacterium]MBD3355606.1 tetratricopeptide repeat protein [Chitinivibrionales bacterium]
GRGKYEEAVVVMEEAARLRPEDAGIHVRLAAVYDTMGDEEARLMHLRTGLEVDRANPVVNLELGKYHYKQGNLKRAGEYLARAVESDSQNARIRYAYAKLLFDTDMKDEAFEHAAWTAKKAPYNVDYLLLHAQAAEATGRREQAIAVTEQALTNETNNMALLKLAGMLYHEEGRLRDAKEWMQKAVSVDDGCGECYRVLGEIHLKENLYTRATSYLRLALDEIGYDERIAMMLGDGLRKSMEYDKARDVFEDVLSKNRSQNEARYYLVHFALLAGNVKQAKELVRKFDRSEKTMWHHLAAGELHEARKEMDAAMISYGVALRLKPECSEALSGFGRVNIARGEYEVAVENIGKAMVANPYNPYLTVDLGRAYEGMGNLASAIEFYKEVVKNYPQVSEAYYCLAGALSRMEKYRKAMSVINEGLSRCPHCPKLYMALGREYQRMAKHEDAVRAYHEAVRKGGESFIDAYMHIASIYANDLEDDKNAEKYFNKYLKAGGQKEKFKKQMAIVEE